MSFNPIRYPILFETPHLVEFSAWIEHTPFSMLLVDLLRPRTIVELGTLRGVSYCSWCQAVARLRLPTRCFAVDTWQGDAHQGEVDVEVLQTLHDYHDPRYGSFSQLIQATFDEAVTTFAENSIDLLHIDGYHTYDSVRHDFETWLPKLSERGVVVFHDIAERKDDFGVWRLWAELSSRYPTIALQHGHGLGVACVGAEIPEDMRELLALDADERLGFATLCHKLGLYAEELQSQFLCQKQREALEVELQQSEEQRTALQANLLQAQRKVARAIEREEGARADYEERAHAATERQRLLSDELAQTSVRLQSLVWMESSRGVHAIKLARASRQIARQRGLVYLTRRALDWLVGKRGLGLK